VCKRNLPGELYLLGSTKSANSRIASIPFVPLSETFVDFWTF
jgi:hypothetical protein